MPNDAQIAIPLALSGALAVLGLGLAVGSLWHADPEPVDCPALTPIIEGQCDCAAGGN